MASRKFDKSAAFKSIIGTDGPPNEQPGQPGIDEYEENSMPSEPENYVIEEQIDTRAIAKAEKTESRDQRRQVIMTKTLAAKVKAKQKKTGLSFNEAVNQLLQMWVDGK